MNALYLRFENIYKQVIRLKARHQQISCCRAMSRSLSVLLSKPNQIKWKELESRISYIRLISSQCLVSLNLFERIAYLLGQTKYKFLSKIGGIIKSHEKGLHSLK